MFRADILFVDEQGKLFLDEVKCAGDEDKAVGQLGKYSGGTIFGDHHRFAHPYRRRVCLFDVDQFPPTKHVVALRRTLEE
jgi:hypothetical protein